MTKRTSTAGVSLTKHPPNTTTVAVTIRLPAALKDKCQRIANADGRTLNNWILQCVKERVK